MLTACRHTHRADVLLSHIALPILLLTLASTLIGLTDLDRLVADQLYALEGGRWAWKSLWLTEAVLHRGGRELTKVLGALAIVAFIVADRSTRWRHHSRSLAYLVIAVLGSTALVSALKHTLGVSCPWEFSRYGGALTYRGVFQQLLLRNGEGCFPAGHASAGYAWVATYFVGLRTQARWRHLALALALLTGLLFGFTQQLRGAHFLSHDLWTLAVCWFWCAGLYLWMFERAPAHGTAPAYAPEPATGELQREFA